MKKLIAVIAMWYSTLVCAQVAPGVPVLLYHRITGAEQPSTMVTPPSVFAQHLDALKKEGYQTITLSNLVTRITKPGRVPAGKFVVITFDDGWKDNLHAGDLLADRGMVGTFFVLSNAFDDPAYLSRTDVQFMSRRHEIGTHSHTHFMKWSADLKKLDDRTAFGEIAMSKQLIEQVIGRPVTSFAWPFGYVKQDLEPLISGLGITGVVQVNGESDNTASTNPLRIQRIVVSGRCSAEQLMQMVETRKMGACPQDDRPTSY